MHRTILYGLTYLAAAMSLGRHVDHVIRHNAVGWPLADEINAFTMSLVIYFGPSAVESPEMMLDGYDSPVLGWAAFTWLVVFVTVLAITSLYETRVWWQQRQVRRAARPATGARAER